MMRKFIPSVLIVPALVLAGSAACQEKVRTGTWSGEPERRENMIEVKSAAFEAGDRIPVKYTGEGEDLSVPLSWSGAPDDTKEFALICYDPDAPTDTPWVHWVLYGIPGGVTSLPEGSVAGAKEGMNNWNRIGYGGPMPPPEHGVHHYHFKVFALDTTPALRENANNQELLEAMAGHVLAEGELVGTYER